MTQRSTPRHQPMRTRPALTAIRTLGQLSPTTSCRRSVARWISSTTPRSTPPSSSLGLAVAPARASAASCLRSWGRSTRSRSTCWACCRRRQSPTGGLSPPPVLSAPLFRWPTPSSRSTTRLGGATPTRLPNSTKRSTRRSPPGLSRCLRPVRPTPPRSRRCGSTRPICGAPSASAGSPRSVMRPTNSTPRIGASSTDSKNCLGLSMRSHRGRRMRRRLNSLSAARSARSSRFPVRSPRPIGCC